MNQRQNRNTTNTVSSGVPMKSEAQRRMERAARRRELELKKKKKIRKNLTIFIIGAILITGTGGIAASILIKTPVEKGNALFQEEQYLEAITEYNNGLEDIEYMAESYLGMGLSYYELGEYADAAKCFAYAIQKGENKSGVVYNLLSISYIALEEYESALENITLGIAQDDITDELKQQLRHNEVLCMEKTGDWEGAKAKATSYLQSYPEDESMAREIKFLETR